MLRDWETVIEEYGLVRDFFMLSQIIISKFCDRLIVFRKLFHSTVRLFTLFLLLHKSYGSFIFGMLPLLKIMSLSTQAWIFTKFVDTATPLTTTQTPYII